MLNNRIDSIKMQSSEKKIARFNLSHDVSTSYAFGEVQPSLCLEMQADSKAVLSKEHLVRPDPVVAPAFGRIVCKNHTRFVPMKNIWPCYGEFLTQTPFSYAGGAVTPTMLPTISLGLLSCMCLIGAEWSMYHVAVGAPRSYSSPLTGTSSADKLMQDVSNWYGSADWCNLSTAFNHYGIAIGMDYVSSAVILGQSFGSSVNDFPDLKIPLKAMGVDLKSHFAFKNADGVTAPAVSLSGYDILVERDFNGSTIAFAFKLSAFGKRIRKILIGLGYEINFDSKVELSILPLFAWYSAYFDTYSSKLWYNFSDTWCMALQGQLLMRLANFAPHTGACGVIDWFVRNRDTSLVDDWCKFIMDLGDCWYQQEMDFVASHTANFSNGQHTISGSEFLDVGMNGTTDKISDSVTATGHMSSNTFKGNPHSLIYRLQHSELYSKFLQRLYRFVNRDSVIGQEVAKQLESRGYGEWMKANPSYYVGNYDFPVRFSEVSSQSDTYGINGSDKGAVLGEYGGKALGYGESETFRFTTREPGYLITLSSVVPIAGYSQSLDLRLLGKDIYSCYNPEFEALGREPSPKLVVQGSLNRCVSTTSADGSLDDTFGFTPRYSRYKVFPNRMNGDFSLHSTRNSYLPYTLDRVINVNELVDIHDMGYNSDGKVYAFSARESLPARTLPHADPLWQYPTKYGYLSNFWRIFALVGDVARNPEQYLNSEYFYLTHQEYDGFKSHIVANLQLYARMLPIEESYETDLEDNDKFNMSAKQE